MRRHNELAIIMKIVADEVGNIEYLPIQVIDGIYDDEEKCFIDEDGTPYYHIIENPSSIGYIYRDNIDDYKKNYPYLSTPLLKRIILNSARKYLYMYCVPKENDQVPVIVYTDKKFTQQPKMLLDKDILEFYNESYPNYIEKILNKNTESLTGDKQELNKSIETALDINKIYSEITKIVIDQDEPIRKILTAIWKQYNNYSESRSRNILINGSTGVGKTEIFRQLTKRLNIPYFMTSATEYTAAGYIGKSVEDMLKGVLKAANYDIEKAQRGILIIDEIDKLSESNKNNSQINQRDVQEALLKILEDGVFNIAIGQREFTFDTSKLMVVGMGSWSRIELTETKPIGFDSKPTKKQYKDITREDIVAAGMIPELIGRFPTIVQMNELDYESFIRILNSENNALNMNKEFLSKRGITLTIGNDTLKEIALRAIKAKYGARSLDEIIETALSIAEFEIASNPDMYEELIITPETIQDNKNYTLVRKKSQ